MSRKISGSEQKRLVLFREFAFTEQGGLCFWCDIPMVRGVEPQIWTSCTGDHLVPLSEGGDTSMGNVVAACMRCNTRRANAANPENARLQRLNLVNPQTTRNHSVAHALMRALGEEAVRRILKQASQDKRSAA